jgi:hypothetical protein
VATSASRVLYNILGSISGFSVSTARLQNAHRGDGCTGSVQTQQLVQTKERKVGKRIHEDSCLEEREEGLVGRRNERARGNSGQRHVPRVCAVMPNLNTSAPPPHQPPRSSFHPRLPPRRRCVAPRPLPVLTMQPLTALCTLGALLLAFSVQAEPGASGGLDPPGLVPLVTRANALLSAGQFSDAAQAYSDAIGEYPVLCTVKATVRSAGFVLRAARVRIRGGRGVGRGDVAPLGGRGAAAWMLLHVRRGVLRFGRARCACSLRLLRAVVARRGAALLLV